MSKSKRKSKSKLVEEACPCLPREICAIVARYDPNPLEGALVLSRELKDGSYCEYAGHGLFLVAHASCVRLIDLEMRTLWCTAVEAASAWNFHVVGGSTVILSQGLHKVQSLDLKDGRVLWTSPSCANDDEEEEEEEEEKRWTWLVHHEASEARLARHKNAQVFELLDARTCEILKSWSFAQPLQDLSWRFRGIFSLHDQEVVSMDSACGLTRLPYPHLIDMTSRHYRIEQGSDHFLVGKSPSKKTTIHLGHWRPTGNWQMSIPVFPGSTIMSMCASSQGFVMLEIWTKDEGQGTSLIVLDPKSGFSRLLVQCQPWAPISFAVILGACMYFLHHCDTYRYDEDLESLTRIDCFTGHEVCFTEKPEKFGHMMFSKLRVLSDRAQLTRIAAGGIWLYD